MDFFRNKKHIESKGGIFGDGFFSSFYETAKDNLQIDSLLEIGWSCGYNLIYMNQKYGMECHGIDPSTKAIEYGEGLIRKKELKYAFCTRLI